jgi:hypothetical protein
MNEDLPLRDIHLPDPVGWWPLAPGWWALGVVLLALAGLGAWLVYRKNHPTLETLALRELDRLREDAGLDAAERLRRLGTLLRRIGLSGHPREEVAGLTGDNWLRWLDQFLETPRFSQGIGRLLVDGPYRRAPAVGMDEIQDLCREWVRAYAKAVGPRRWRARKP